MGIRIVILTGLLQLLSCLNESPDNKGLRVGTVDVVSALERKRPLYLSELSASIDYIPISSDNTPDIRGIFLFSSTNSYMLISDLQGCYLFDTTGLFIRRIGRIGRGPEEYPFIGQIALGKDNMVYVYCVRKLYVFDINGGFKKVTDFYDTPMGTFGNWLYLDDGTFLVQVCNDTGVEKSKSLIINNEGQILNRFINYMHFEKDRVSASTLSEVSSIYSFNGLIRYKELFNDTLFTLFGDTSLIPVLSFNLGKLKATPIEYSNNTTGRIRFTREHARVYDIFETNNFLFFDLQTNLYYLKRPEPLGGLSHYYTTRLLGVYDKDIKSTSFVDITRTDEKLLISGIYNDIDGGPKFYPRFRMGDNKFAMPIQPLDLIKYTASDSFKNATAKYPDKKIALEKLANSLSEEDNPVLMVVRMK